MKTAIFVLLALVTAAPAFADDLWIEFKGEKGPGAGKKIVLVSGDDEYRSEESMPMLGKLLATHHGFHCVVLFAIDEKTGEIKPDHQTNIPGLEALKDADLMMINTRFRNLPDDQMKHIDDYLKTGKPVIGMRTATHAFNIPKGKTYSHYGNGYGGEDFKGGFGRQVLGEKWISHHGGHKRQATRGIIADGQADHPIVTGIKPGEIFGLSDVYGVRLPLPGDSKPIILGAVLEGMKVDDKPVEGKKNDPMMPVAWTKSYQLKDGKEGMAFNTTMGASVDLIEPGLRRLLVNAVFYMTGMQESITADLNVEPVGKYEPMMYGFGSYQKGKKPADYR